MSPEEIVNEFMARVVRMDLDAACELVSDDVEYDNVPMGKVYGPDGIKGVLGPMVGALDEVDWVIHRQVATGNARHERAHRPLRHEREVDGPPGRRGLRGATTARSRSGATTST